MNNTQKALINQDVCEQTTPNLGITQSSGLEQHTAEKRKEICDSVLALINEKFPANPHLDIALQYSALLDYTRIKAETAAVTPKLIGKTCSFQGKDGRIQQVEDKIFFFPKRYRRYGYPLDDMDLLILAWSLGIATEVPA